MKWKQTAKMYRERSRVDREDRERWKRCAAHFADWASAFEQAITAGDTERACALAEQFRKHGSSERPSRIDVLTTMREWLISEVPPDWAVSGDDRADIANYIDCQLQRMMQEGAQ